MRRTLLALRTALAAGLAVLLAGCGGVSASRSVSPASFLLPGLIQNDAPATPSSEDAVPADGAQDEQFGG
jgi:hypothetical protein